MRVAALTLAAACFVTAFSACGGGAPGRGAAHPDGWTSHGQGAATYWTYPPDPAQRFSVTSRPNAPGTLSDMASEVSMNTILRYKGAKLIKAEPFPACPGEAGRQTFRLSTARGPAMLQVAFTQWTGTAVTVSYERPAGEADRPEATDAMRRSVCSSVAGG